MKRLFTVILLFLAVPAVCVAQPRQVLFNEGWRFVKGDVSGGEAAAYDDSGWRKLDLPHDWSIEGPFSEEWASGTGYLPGGIGWYRKTFELAPEYQSLQVYVYFDGVYKNSEVWINGHSLGRRPNGYIPFYYELTPYLNKTGRNTLAVRVDHSKFADSRWYPGSGIYRNVYLVAVEPVHVDLWGVAFTTPEVTPTRATAQVAVSVANQSTAGANVEVHAELRDTAGKTVAQAVQAIETGAGRKAETNLNVEVEKPALWSVDTPNLYTLVVSTYAAGRKTDETSESVGFRTFRFDANTGFTLNGQNLKLKGVCFHHDAGALGAAVPEEVWRRRLQSLKALGCNAIRMSHYPHQDYLYRLMDQLGFVVMDEAFDEWETGKNKWIEGWNVGTPGKDGYHEYFAEWAERDVRDMILRNRNHASIMMWSIGNEIDYPNDPYTHEVLDTGRNPQIYGKGFQPGNPPASRLGEIAGRLAAVVRQTDTSRPVTAALAGVVMSNFTTYPETLDLVGYNYQEYRYPEDHTKYPDRIIYGSENGKGLDAWLPVDTLAYISGQFLWTAFDFMGEARSWPVRSSGAGLLDLAGYPKPEYYFRQSLWSDRPMVYAVAGKIQPSTENQRGPGPKPSWNGSAGDRMNVSCYTNTDEAELFLNGKSLGRKSKREAVNRVLNWEVDYTPGTLRVVGYRDGREAARHELKTAGEPYALKAVADRQTLSGTGRELAHVDVVVVDRDGNPVYDAENEVTVALEGPAALLGLESGSLSSHEDYRSNRRKTLHGRLLAYVQSRPEAGKVRLTLSSPGLQPATLEVDVR